MCLQYHNLDTITTRASKLLGDCKIGNIEKEIKKLKAVDTKPLENKISDLRVELAVQKDKVEGLRKQLKSFEILKKAIGEPGDVVNKARLFDEDVKLDGEVSAAKVIKVLVTFTRKMETALVEIRKAIARIEVGESSRPPRPPPTETPYKEKPLSEVKTPLPQRSEKEPIAETSAAALLDEAMAPKTTEAIPLLAASPIPKGKRSVSTEPSPQKGKKEKQVSSMEEEELDDTSEGAGSLSGET